MTDTERLDWLLKMGYTPAKWRPWVPGDGPTSNGMVYLGQGTRDEIDAAIQAQKQRDEARKGVE
jgi:hypothetical protein